MTSLLKLKFMRSPAPQTWKILNKAPVPIYQDFLHPFFPWSPQKADTCAACRGSLRFSEADASLAAPWKLNALLKTDSGSIWRSTDHKKRREHFMGMFHTSEFPLFPVSSWATSFSFPCLQNLPHQPHLLQSSQRVGITFRRETTPL